MVNFNLMKCKWNAIVHAWTNRKRQSKVNKKPKKITTTTTVIAFGNFLFVVNAFVVEFFLLLFLRLIRTIKCVLTWEWYDCVDLNRMHGLTIGRDHCHTMSFDGHLCRTHRRKRIDQSESIPATRRYGEYLERCIGHEASVRVTELTATIDEHRFGILAGVDGKTARITLSGVFVQPIADQHDVCRQIEVIQMRIGIAWWWLSHNHTTVQTIDFL